MSAARLVHWLFAFALVHGLVYASIIPPWQGPDETGHFEYARLLAERRHPLSLDDASPSLEQAIIESLFDYRAWSFLNWAAPAWKPARLVDTPFFGRPRTLNRFSLAYVPYALAVSPFLDQSVAFQLYIMRAVSVVCGAIVVVLAFKITQLVTPNSPPLAIGVAASVLFLPQHAFVTASVNDGNLAEVFAAGVCYMLISIIRTGWSWKRAALGLIFLLAALLTKATTYYLVPLVLIAGPELALYALPSRRLFLERKWILPAVTLIGLIVVIGIGLSAMRALSVQLEYIRASVTPNLTRLLDPIHYLALSADGRIAEVLWTTFRSYWMTFGWMALSMSDVVYVVLAMLVIIAIAGWRVSRSYSEVARNDRLALRTMELAAALTVIVLVGWFVVSPAGLEYSQGRYLFGGIVPIMLILVGGCTLWAKPLYQTFLVSLFVVMMLWLDTLALWHYAMPFFYAV